MLKQTFYSYITLQLNVLQNTEQTIDFKLLDSNEFNLNYILTLKQYFTVSWGPNVIKS